MYLTRRTQDFIPTLFNDLMNMDTISYSEPKMNIIENKENYLIQYSVPGLKKEDLKISIDTEGNLVVEMSKENNHKDERKENGTRFLRREFSTEQFRNTLVLPEDIHRNQITAKVENGILEVTLPRETVEEKKALMQTIEVH
ncbi:MAG: Hsp20/alpha crystallin family protein [Bacteroidales bacterium]|nr:Hsp20/alpha crystallin family protein [Bacteroidales bacterium]